MALRAVSFKFKTFESLSDVPAEDWDELASQGSVAMSRAFWGVIERSGMNDFKYRYLVLYVEGRAVAIAGVYTVTTDVAIFSPPLMRKLLQSVRRLFPSFLKWRMLECGTPITISSPPFVRRADVADAEVIDALAGELDRLAKRDRCQIIVVRDFEPNAQHMRLDFARHGYHWVNSLPNTYLEVRWQSVEQYYSAMRSYYRSKLLKHLKRNRAMGVHHELVEDFSSLADALCAQWMQVHLHASEFQREVLTPAFYRDLPAALGSKARVLLFYRGDDWVGHALLLMDGDMLRWLYVGRKVACNDSLYIYIAAAVVETAIALGAKRLEMGLTTYPIKQDLGAQVVPIKLALRASSRLINPFVGLGYSLLNKVPAPGQRQVFKTVKQLPAA